MDETARDGTNEGGRVLGPDDVLAFWFEELESKQWFTRSDAVDATIQKRFAPTYAFLSGHEASDLPDAWTGTARNRLAAIVVLDQFPRNLFRGSARSFESDGKALALSKQMIARGLDGDLSPVERMFAYMPYQHSEELATQEESVALFGALDYEDTLKYAVAHRDVIARFGRFPHRNAVLGRSSTPEEEKLLESPGLFW